MRACEKYTITFHAFFNKWVTPDSMDIDLQNMKQEIQLFNNWDDLTYARVSKSFVWKIVLPYYQKAKICRMSCIPH